MAAEASKSLISIQKFTHTAVDDKSIEVENWTTAYKSSNDHCSASERDRLRELEEEQQHLNNSLLSISTHFAQVQFRLKQISKADVIDRDKLLKELEEFAFKGCVEIDFDRRKISEKGLNDEGMGLQKQKQKNLIARLKEQLEDLEKFAYEMGDGELPSTEVIARQRTIIDRLLEKVQMDIELDKMPQDDLQKKIDEALKKLIIPTKAKEKLLEQLQTQVVDLERFVSFLQKETNDVIPTSVTSLPVLRTHGDLFNLFGSSQRLERNQLKNTIEGNHYGDARARLQLAVEATIQVMEKYNLLYLGNTQITPTNESSSDEIFEWSEEEVVSIVRKALCPALRRLLEHGMNASVKKIIGFSPFGCYPTVNRIVGAQRIEHLWDIITYYYNSKFDREFSDAPIRRLSQSFQLDSVGTHSITSKQILLSTIETVTSTHMRLKRTPDTMWKALVSAALNERKLPAWIRIVFRAKQVVENCYASWSYVSRTGCEDCYELLERLQKYNFHLPVDLAVRPFHQMKNAF